MITIIKADKDLCKRTDGNGGLLAYQNAFLYESETQNVKNIEEFSALLKELEGRPRYGILRDEPIASGRGRRTKERFQRVPRSWLLLDHDAPAPEGCPDYVENPEEALRWMIEHKWSFLKGVGIHWQLGNSAGVVPASEKMSWHLWVMLDHPVANASKWLDEHGFDTSMTNPVQIHYTASPIGVDLNKRSGLIHGGLLSGVTENPPPTKSGVKFQAGYKCTESDIAAMDMEYEALNGDKGRHPAIRFWILRAVSVGYPDVHSRAVDKLVSWGKSETVAEADVARLIAWCETGLADGSLEVDPTLRPDLVFDDEEDIALTPSEAKEQTSELKCSNVIEEFTKVDKDERLTWLKDNVRRVSKLGQVDRELLKNAWGLKSAIVDKAVREYQRETDDGEEEDWAEIARSFIEKRGGALAYIEEEWYSFNGRFYEKIKEVAVKKEVSDYIKKPTQSRVGNAFQQVQFVCLASRVGEPEGIPFMNGRLMPDGKLVEHTPQNSGVYCLAFDYDPTAKCPEFMKVMGEQWFREEGDERPLILRQWYNYLLTGREDLHKVMLMVGPPRAGKGTNMKIMQAMLGDINFTSPRTKDFLSDFGLQQAVGKRAIFMPDVHLPNGQKSEIAERVKTIAGKDSINIQRKYLTPLENIQLGQIVMGCNYLTDVEDESNALVDRLSVLHFTEEYTGKEDTGLKDRLLSELSGVFNWAMACPKFKHFHEDSRGHDMKKDMSLAANPVRAWAKEYLAEGDFIFSDDLYQSYTTWCEEQEVSTKTAKNAFIRKVKMVFPKAESRNHRVDGKVKKALYGVSLSATDLEGNRYTSEEKKTEKDKNF